MCEQQFNMSDICKSEDSGSHGNSHETRSELDDHDEHLRLAGVVKGVHADLRKQYRSNNSDLEKVWYDHCQDKTTLSHYAQAMHHLATQHWTKNPETRIDWCRDIVNQYFHKDGLKSVFEKETRRRQHEDKKHLAILDIDTEHCDSDLHQSKPGKYNTVLLPVEGKIRLLDVGSCYNPFLAFPELQAIGIDISPATDTVFHCDFLHLRTTDHLQVAMDTMQTFINNLKDPVEWLPRESFHVMVFSLLLEYFPAPYQRWICCQKAHELLMYNGILVIITPDSSHQNRKAPMIKSWKIAIESLGFIRWKYVKLEHIHCMVFRKIEISDKDKQENFLKGITPDMIFIPQDKHNDEDIEPMSGFGAKCYSEEDEQFYVNHILHELPQLSSDSDENL